MQQKENNKEELHKNEVFKYMYMLSKLVKYNLGKKLQIYQFTQHFFSQPVYFTNRRWNGPLYHNDWRENNFL